MSKGVFPEVCLKQYVPVVCPKELVRVYIRVSLTKACSSEYAQVIYHVNKITVYIPMCMSMGMSKGVYPEGMSKGVCSKEFFARACLMDYVPVVFPMEYVKRVC